MGYVNILYPYVNSYTFFRISAYFSQQGVEKFSNCLRGDLVSPWVLDPWGDGKFLEISWG